MRTTGRQSAFQPNTLVQVYGMQIDLKNHQFIFFPSPVVRQAAKEQSLRYRSNERRKSYTLGDVAKFTGSAVNVTEYKQALANLKPYERFFSKFLMR